MWPTREPPNTAHHHHHHHYHQGATMAATIYRPKVLFLVALLVVVVLVVSFSSLHACEPTNAIRQAQQSSDGTLASIWSSGAERGADLSERTDLYRFLGEISLRNSDKVSSYRGAHNKHPNHTHINNIT